jgi:hypothetical protein
MSFSMFAALALAPALAASPQTQAPAPAVDYSVATPIGGDWSYAATADGSETTFVGASLQPQITIRCTRATRRVALAKPASAAAPFLSIWTSTQSRNAPASFNPATARLTAELGAFDPMLDAIAFSRGRVAFSIGSAPALVVPSWSEISRVIEDCRT